MRAVPRHYLAGPHGRHYEFIPVEGAVVVRRWVAEQREWSRELPTPAARSRWAWLLKLGYRPVETKAVECF